MYRYQDNVVDTAMALQCLIKCFCTDHVLNIHKTLITNMPL